MQLGGDQEIAFLHAAAAHLGEGARRALRLGAARDPDGPDAPGLLVLSAEGELVSPTPGSEDLVASPPGAWTCRPRTSG